MFERMTRRSVLAAGLSSVAATALAGPKFRRRHHGSALRIVHLTDVHLKTGGDAPAQLTRCLEKIRRVEQPDLIFQGGDIVMDGLDADRATVQTQFDLAGKLLSDHSEAQVVHCIGNHDVWAWRRPDRASLAHDRHFGKAWWLDWTGYPSTYFSFDRAGWHFVFLDSIHEQGPAGYEARLCDIQWEWLQKDLEATPSNTPVCIVSHVPFMHAGAQFIGTGDQTKHQWSISGTLVHMDARKIKDLLSRHPNVRLCLSGHIHMSSRIHYNGVTHIGNGAVCGAWWKGDMQETAPGYGVVDLFADGHVMPRYEHY